MRSLLCAVILALCGCASQPSSYTQLPKEYTDISSHTGAECYLIEIIQAFARPSAIRFDFDLAGNLSIQTYTLKGPGPVVKMTGAEAARRLRAFRSFDWNTLGKPSIKEEGFITLHPDETEIILKASTERAYREASGGVDTTPELIALLKAVSL